MAKPLASWCARDLETTIVWLMSASDDMSEIENNPHIANHIRELASDARTNVKAALMLTREMRSAHENISSDGQKKGK